MDDAAAEAVPMLPVAGPLDANSPHALSDAALGYARQALSPATRRAYGSHLRAWEAWCTAKGAVAAPAAPALVANHLAGVVQNLPFLGHTGVRRPPACEGRITTGGVSFAGGGRPPRSQARWG